jgi:hypothetical protein
MADSGLISHDGRRIVTFARFQFLQVEIIKVVVLRTSILLNVKDHLCGHNSLLLVYNLERLITLG